ncbi:MAG: hypothetical protein EOM19_01485 [Candidatus Moranbacteria bacterium]|nr:hypothetical protein [Candidatus Moranbacteria bacterium]
MRAYKVISLLTLFLPMIILLVFFYITSNQGIKEVLEAPNVVFPNVDKRYDYIVDTNDYWSIDAEEKTISFHAESLIYEDIKISSGTVTINYPEFFSMGNKYYSIDENDNLVLFDAAKLVKERMFEKNFLIGLSIFITIVTALCITMMVIKKMQLMNRHRRLSVVVSSWVFTIFFLILYVISEQVYLIFLVFSMSFTAYYIEWLIHRKKNGLPLHDQISQRVVITND